MKFDNLEDIYELSPIQQGILYHSISDNNEGMYVVQIIFTLKGKLDLKAFSEAWQKVTELHPVLRTSFQWEGLEKPVQIVFKKVSISCRLIDWQDDTISEIETKLSKFLTEDREKGFILSSPPLLRLSLIRTGEVDYKFILTHHHIILDGWSVGIILEDFYTLYESCSQNLDITLTPSKPYSDYISFLQKQEDNNAESYWRETLSGFTTPTVLNTLSSDAKHKGKEETTRQEAHLSVDLSRKVNNFARMHQLTLNTIFQGAWALLLSGYANNDDVVFGAVVSGRPAGLAGIEKMTGLFINTLPFRVNITSEDNALTYLNKIQQQHSLLRQFESTPLTKIREWGEIEGGLPLFENIFVFQSFPIDEKIVEGRDEIRISDIQSLDRTNYPLSLYINPGQPISLVLKYDPGKYSAKTINGMLQHLQTLLSQIISNGNLSLSGIEMLTKTERELIVNEWNNTSVAFPGDKCCHELFEQQASETPSSPAAIYQDSKLTYQELNFRANRLAHYLLKKNSGQVQRAGIYLNRSTDMLVALLAALKSGAAFIPLDPSFPESRIRYMIKDSNIDLLITDSSLKEHIQQFPGQFVVLDDEEIKITSESQENPHLKVNSNNLAYIIYTSGSTGKPKGVKIRHRSLVNFLTSMQKQPGISDQDRLLALTTLSFDISLLELLLPLISGASVEIISQEIAADGFRLKEKIVQCKPTIIQATPATWHMLIDAGWEGMPELKILCGGDILTADLAAELLKRCASLWNMYGPTETTIWSSIYKVASVSAKIPIGKPIANTQIYILDRMLKPLPVGVAGELHIGGEGLARGYLNLNKLTKTKFIDDPFKPGENRKIYKTGDLARFLPDGNIEILGRIDNQVKIRGFRIELSEIESILRKHTAVNEAVVVARHNSMKRDQLVAYLVPENSQPIDTEEVRRFIESYLPFYMIPSYFVILDKFPLTPNGKLNKKALPDPGNIKSSEHSEETILTEMEKSIAEIWEDALEVSQINRDDNFFDLGGHSLLAMRVVSQIEKKTGARIHPGILALQTLGQIAAHCENLRISSANKSPKSFIKKIFS